MDGGFAHGKSSFTAKVVGIFLDIRLWEGTKIQVGVKAFSCTSFMGDFVMVIVYPVGGLYVKK